LAGCSPRSASPPCAACPRSICPPGGDHQEQFGVLGVAFTPFSWLSACAFVVVVATVVGAVLAEDPGRLGRFIRAPRR
jgi:hypothetical protein